MIVGKNYGINLMKDETPLAGATPGEDESGLLLPHLTDRAIRNAVELESISQAYDKYVYRSRRKKSGWLTEAFIRQTHSDMLGAIWDWAGKYRQLDLNIGVPWHSIQEQIKRLCDDFLVWEAPQSSMPLIEIAARLQNRLTLIHPFQNGNGRHARFITDIFFSSRNHPLPKWPQIQIMEAGDGIRNRYIAAMKTADGGDFSQLGKFISDCIDEKF